MEFTGTFKDISSNFLTNQIQITFTANEKSIFHDFEKLKDCKKLRIKVDKYRKKRSLDANAYAWQLMSKIALALKSDKDAIYEIMLQKYGTFYEDETGANEKISVLSHIDITKFGLHTKFIGKSYAGDKEFSHYIVIKGSSEYDTREMSQFIDGIVSDAKDLEIETLPPHELNRMKEMWGGK